MSNKQDKIRGCLLGLAVGDAMGYTVDKKTLEEIKEELYFRDMKKDREGRHVNTQIITALQHKRNTKHRDNWYQGEL